MKKFFFQVFAFSLVIGIISLTGCASTSSTRFIEPVSVNLSNFRSMMVDVSSKVPDSGNEIAQLESEIISRLRDQELFERIFSRAAGHDVPHDLRLAVTITQLKKVSTAARLMIGAFAGRGKLVVDVELFDAMTGEKIAQASCEGVTSGGTVFAGTTPQAVQKVVDEVVNLVERNM